MLQGIRSLRKRLCKFRTVVSEASSFVSSLVHYYAFIWFYKLSVGQYHLFVCRSISPVCLSVNITCLSVGQYHMFVCRSISPVCLFSVFIFLSRKNLKSMYGRNQGGNTDKMECPIFNTPPSLLSPPPAPSLYHCTGCPNMI